MPSVDQMWFCCDKCNNLDNLRNTTITGGQFLCYRCVHGEWHDIFPERKYDPAKDVATNRGKGNEPSFG